MVRRLVRLVRGRIVVKLTLALVGVVAVTVVAADLYLSRALQAFAVESLENRLALAARLLHDEARNRRAGRPAPHRSAGAPHRPGRGGARGGRGGGGRPVTRENRRHPARAARGRGGAPRPR